MSSLSPSCGVSHPSICYMFSLEKKASKSRSLLNVKSWLPNQETKKISSNKMWNKCGAADLLLLSTRSSELFFSRRFYFIYFCFRPSTAQEYWRSRREPLRDFATEWMFTGSFWLRRCITLALGYGNFEGGNKTELGKCHKAKHFKKC